MARYDYQTRTPPLERGSEWERGAGMGGWGSYGEEWTRGRRGERYGGWRGRGTLGERERRLQGGRGARYGYEGAFNEGGGYRGPGYAAEEAGYGEEFGMRRRGRFGRSRFAGRLGYGGEYGGYGGYGTYGTYGGRRAGGYGRQGEERFGWRARGGRYGPEYGW